MSRGEVVSAAAPLAAGYLAADPVYSIIRQFIGTSAGSTVAIDNKIEQAMDLVKSHLMFAVREEVDVLKEKITELLDRIAQLEYENGILRAGASPETLSLLAQPTAQQQASQQPPAAQPPQQQQQQQQQVLAAAAQPVVAPLPLQQPQAPAAVGAVQPVVAAAGVPTQPAPQLAAVAQQLQPPPPSPQQQQQQPVQLHQPPQQAQQAQQQKQPPPLQQLPPT